MGSWQCALMLCVSECRGGDQRSCYGRRSARIVSCGSIQVELRTQQLSGLESPAVGNMADVSAMLLKDPSWTRERFFHSDATSEHSLKVALAKVLGLRYGTTNVDKPVAIPVGGVAPYDGEMVAELAAESEQNIGLSHFHTCTISAMLVSWTPCGALNVDYVLDGCQKYVDQWDPSIERKAGGYDTAVDPSSQHFTLTNMSSLLRLVCEDPPPTTTTICIIPCLIGDASV